MTGADLRCDCGGYARDVDPAYVFHDGSAVSWTCTAGHHLITGNGVTNETGAEQINLTTGAERRKKERA